ncbi:hypothetical protein CWI38_0592p0010 [Hamiltosporidium tvaerminnensis]|uniref:Rho-GAP domain-containing protein n=1 Tax=Hamiltosporidium tvaerminnensis TaxID=1176355 RepID=A0A4Q9LW68_9MICR|nr:hypothetical protein CWI38_0592p0010 [Hamiltosporidium tvaerminnensis]
MNGIISVQIAERVMKIIKNQTDPSIIEYIVPLIIFSITNENRKMLMYLQKIFRKVDQYSKDNKMGSDNLYKIFTPTIFPNIECYDLQSINLQIEIVKRIFESNLTEIPCFLYEEALSSKLLSGVERLFHTRLNAKNLFSAINQTAISLINHHIGVLRLELADFSKLDDAVRAVLVKNKVHIRPGCKDRLYLSRTELGRDLNSVKLRSEHMLLLFLDRLEKSKEISTRRAAILRVENNNKTHLALIKGFLKVKYRLVEEVIKKSLEEAQLAKLYNEIEKRKLYSKLYNARKNELLSVSDSSRWLKRGNIRPRNEAVFCYIQDRNVLWGADGMRQHCGKSGKTVDHLATRCEKMLGYGYTRRHNEVVRCLHLLLLNRYKYHSVQEIFDNEYAEIRVNTRIKTDVKIRNNRPEIFILDKKKNKITHIKVGITSQNSLQIVETEKLRKYDLLANELGLIYKCNVEIIPCDDLGQYLEVYIQSIVLNKTVETISSDRRRGLESGLNAEESWERASMDGAKNFKPKNKAPFISQGGTTLEEPTNNINKESDSEEETKLVKEVEENI